MVVDWVVFVFDGEVGVGVDGVGELGFGVVDCFVLIGVGWV